MIFFGKKPPKDTEGNNSTNEKTGHAMPPKKDFNSRKAGPDMIETYYIHTVFGRTKISTEYYTYKKKQKLIFEGITDLPDCVRTVIPHTDGNKVDGVYRVFMKGRKSLSSIITDANGSSHVEKSVNVPIIEFVPLYMITPEEKDELAGIIEWVRKSHGKAFEVAKLASVESVMVRDKLRSAKLLYKGAKVRQDFDIAELSTRVKEVLRPANEGTLVLTIISRADPAKEDSFMLIECGKNAGIENPGHLLKVENLIDLGPQFAGMERAHLSVMAQKGVVIGYDDGGAALILPIAKKEI
ncbi:MAG: hypothetical protein N3G76_01355 [Candidatus Micrarchaeota archaeon]|nr:hypothetical protein [Candidatus Micrarchaeota archaeon]